MYAIALDFELDVLEKTYTNFSLDKVEKDIMEILLKYNFRHYQYGLYLGNVDAVTCVLAVMDLAKQNPWFAPSVSDIRMLRIEDNNDLMPAVKKAIA